MVAASGCAPPMPPRPAVRIQRPARLPPIVLARHLDEGLVGALHDALAADVDPRARRHLAEHHQALAVELVEMLPGRPVRHEVGVGDQHARRVGVGAEDADRLARLHQQRLVGLELAQRRDDAVEALPVARRAADAAIDDELVRPLGDLGIEVVHQHAQRRLGQPALGRDVRCRAARGWCGCCRGAWSWRASAVEGRQDDRRSIASIERAAADEIGGARDDRAAK